MKGQSRKLSLLLAAALALQAATMACGGNFRLPVNQIKTGNVQSTEIQIPMPGQATGSVELNLDFIGGEMKLGPGAGEYLVLGSATYNVADFEPKTEISGSSVTLSTGDQEIEGVPIFRDEIVNKWDLKLADTPMSLNIQAGGYQGSFEFGGLALEKLSVTDGGASVKGAFSSPNKIEMSTFKYSTGASSAELTGLSNANFALMEFTAGAGDYTLSFDGKLQRDAKVTIEAGVGTVSIIVPQGLNVQVRSESGLAAVNIEGGWTQDGSLYNLPGSGPTLTITVDMGAGTLNLKTN